MDFKTGSLENLYPELFQTIESLFIPAYNADFARFHHCGDVIPQEDLDEIPQVLVGMLGTGASVRQEEDFAYVINYKGRNIWFEMTTNYYHDDNHFSFEFE